MPVRKRHRHEGPRWDICIEVLNPRKVVFMRTRSYISPIGITRLNQRPPAPLSQPGASVTWSQCSVNFPSFTRTVSNANAS